MSLERILCLLASIILMIFVGKLILDDAYNLVPIFATVSLGVALLGTINYDDW